MTVSFMNAVVLGTLAAIVYSLRILVRMERRVQSVELNIQRMTSRILREEEAIQKALKKRKSSSKRKKTTRRKK